LIAEESNPLYEIDKKNLKLETCRASGAGGQHVNKTDSAVRITHIPTGIAVKCQAERSQSRNKEIAMQILKARIFTIQRKQKEKQLLDAKASLGDISWGNQIRSYVLAPYQMIKDNRTNMETPHSENVLNGEEELDEFLKAGLALK
jgi:peptide chain release factor 2